MAYKNGYLDGLLISFYDNGVTKNKTYYKKGIKDGLEQRYYKNGQVQSEERFLDGKPSGDLKYLMKMALNKK